MTKRADDKRADDDPHTRLDNLLREYRAALAEAGAPVKDVVSGYRVTDTGEHEVYVLTIADGRLPVMCQDERIAFDARQIRAAEVEADFWGRADEEGLPVHFLFFVREPSMRTGAKALFTKLTPPGTVLADHAASMAPSRTGG